MERVRRLGIVISLIVFCLLLTVVSRVTAETATVDCDAGGAVGPVLARLKPGDVVLVQGACRENILIQAGVTHVTLDGQGKATITPRMHASPPSRSSDARSRSKASRSREDSSGSRSTGAQRRSSRAIRCRTPRSVASRSPRIALLVSSRTGFGKTSRMASWCSAVRPSTSRHANRCSSTARIIGNTISGNRRHGLTVQQASHADVAANVFNGNGEDGIRVFGTSGVNLADSAMRLFEQPNTTTAPNGKFGIRCEVGAYIEGPLGTLSGNAGAKNVSDSSCVDRATP